MDTIKQLIVEGTRSFPVRRRASEIMALAESRDSTAEIQAVFNWMRSRIPFRQDPIGLELLETPERALKEIDREYGYGLDCDGMVTLAGALLTSMGHPIRLVLTGPGPEQWNHIYLETFARDGSRWIPFDLAMPSEPLGWYPKGQPERTVIPFDVEDLIPPDLPKKKDGGRMQPEQLGKMPADYKLGSVVVLPDGGAWIREGKIGSAGYWRLVRRVHTPRTLGQVEWLAPEEEELTTGRELPGLQPAEMEHRIIDHSRADQHLYILLTQPQINPRRLSKLFGYRRTPRQRAAWRAEHYKFQKAQNDLPYEQQITLGEWAVKIPRAGYTAGNSVSTMLDHFEYLFYLEERGGEEFFPGDPGSMDWSDLIPDPDELFGDGLWSDIVGAMTMNNLTVQHMMDAYGILSGGQSIGPTELEGSDLASQMFVDMDVVIDLYATGRLGELTIGAILAILAAVGAIIAALGKAIVEILQAVRDVADPIAGAIAEVKSGIDGFGSEVGGLLEDGRNAQRELESTYSGDPPTGDEWLEKFRDDQEQAILLATTKDGLNRWYEEIEYFGWGSSQAAMFRNLVEWCTQQSSIFYVIAKERVLRDLRTLKILALADPVYGLQGNLQGNQQAEGAFADLLADMAEGGPIISSWATEYAELPWNDANTDIPGVPDPNPPGRLPPGRYPHTGEDDLPDNPYAPDEEVEAEFDEDTAEIRGAGGPVQWAGPAPKQLQQRVQVAPGISVDIAPGAGRAGVEYAKERGAINGDQYLEAGKRRKVNGEPGWIARHPVATVATVGAAGAGLWYGWPIIKRLFAR